MGLRRQGIPRLLEPARQPQRRAPASEGRRRHQGPGRRHDHDRARTRQHRARRGGEPHPGARGAATSRASSSPTRSGRQRERDPAGAPDDRPRHGARPIAATTATRARRSSPRGTGAASPNQFARGHVHFFGPFLYRSEFWADSPEQESERALRHLERVILSEGASTIAAILLETVPGTAGVLVPPPGYLEGRSRVVRPVRHRADLRRGHVRFRSDGGLVRLAEPGLRRRAARSDHLREGASTPVTSRRGGVIISDPIANAFVEEVFPGGLTYSGHPLAMASIVATLDAMGEEKIVENAASVGADVLGPRPSAAGGEASDRRRRARRRGVLGARPRDGRRDPARPCPAPSSPRRRPGSWRPVFCHSRPTTASTSCRPCTVSPDEVAAALAIYDEVFTAIER